MWQFTGICKKNPQNLSDLCKLLVTCIVHFAFAFLKQESSMTQALYYVDIQMYVVGEVMSLIIK